MKAAFRIAALSVFLIVSTTVEAGDAPRTVPTVRFDRVQGVVVSSNPEARTVDVRLPGGGTQRLRIAGNAWLHTLRGLDERERMLATLTKTSSSQTRSCTEGQIGQLENNKRTQPCLF